MEGLTRCLSAVMATASAMRVSTPDQLLGSVLEELLGAVDDAALGWIYLIHTASDNAIWPVVADSPQGPVCLAALRHVEGVAPELAAVARQDCLCFDSLVGTDPPPGESVVEHCSQPVHAPSTTITHVCVPLFVENRPIGVLGLAKTASTSFSPVERLLVKTVSSQLGMALENADLIGKTRARLKETQTLLDVSHSVNSTLDLEEIVRRIARAIVEVLSADTAGAYLLDHTGKQLLPFAGYHLPKHLLDLLKRTEIPVEGFRFVEEAFAARAAVYASDTEGDHRLGHSLFRVFSAKSGLFVPMLAKERIVGGLFVIWWERPHHFTRGEIGLVDAIAHQTAIAIENAKLFEEVQTHARAAKASEEKYRLLAEHVRDVIYALDAEGQFTYINPRIEELLGYAPEELLGRYCTDILAPASQRRARKIFARAVKGKDPFSFYELDIVKKGDAVAVSFEIGAVTTRDATGKVTGWHGVARDVTVRKRLEQQLLRTERLRALGEMASGVAHDFNNILGAILGRAQILRETVQDTDTKRGLEAIEKAALDGATTVRRLQHFTRSREEEECFPVDLNQVIRDALAITEVKWKDESNLAGVTIDVATSYGTIPAIMGNISELREVLTNLIFNAVEAMPTGGTLTLTTERQDGWVCVSVADTGIGMTDEVRIRMFDPFFTTKGVKGTGLGLSVSYGIIRGHHGEITAQSQPGQGTTVLIKLPIPSKLRSTPPLPPTSSAKPGRILVIDDDEMIRDLLSELLQTGSHTVVQAGGGREGLRLFSESHFDLVLTDLGMPECSGWDVASAIKRVSPRTPVALITGWGLTLDRSKLKDAGVDLVLSKPFQVAELMALVAEGLELREKT